MGRLARIVERLPEAERVDIEEWGGHPTFRVRGKNFVFSDLGAERLTLKLPKEEAAAVVATEPDAEPAAYGLGRHGWVVLAVPTDADDGYWALLEEWVRTSYALVAPKKLARQVLEEDGVEPAGAGGD
jgi:predicted DNA-binding protein (MmcQ/YjbR family)